MVRTGAAKTIHELTPARQGDQSSWRHCLLLGPSVGAFVCNASPGTGSRGSRAPIHRTLIDEGDPQVMASIGMRVLLFGSSYSPLFLILAIQNRRHAWAAGAFLTTSLLGAAGLLVFMRVSGRTSTRGVAVVHARQRDGDVAGYVVGYLLPFLDLDVGMIGDALSLGVLLLVVGVIYVHSNMIYVNPLLAASGLHLFEVDQEGGNPVNVLTRRKHLRPGEVISVVSLGDYALLEKEP
jgi:hypothetical protein